MKSIHKCLFINNDSHKNKYFFKIIFFLYFFFILANLSVKGQCNTEVPIPYIENTFGNMTATGTTSGLCLLCSASNPSRLIDADLTNFATASIPLGVGGAVNFRVTDTDTDYTAGTFVGYRIAPSGGLSVAVLNTMTIRTYLNGTLRETSSGSNLLNVNVFTTPGSYVVGFNSTLSFDAIEISIGSLVGLLNTVDVYYPLIRNYCVGPALACNEATGINLPVFPVSIEPAHTGLSGLSVGSISDLENVISSSTTDFATINLSVGLLASGSIAVKDQLTDYAVGTFAGFEIENSSLLSVAALGNIEITTYLNGTLAQQFSGNNLVVNGTLLTSSGRYKVGFVSSQAFDEVQISINQIVGVNLGITKVYNTVLENFCAGPGLACNTAVPMNEPTYPVFINGINTGIDGLVCVGCTVVNTANLIDADTTNFAEIDLLSSVGSGGSISIKDQITDYVAGSFVGFDIENTALLDVNVLNAIVLTTYLNGVEQEVKTGSGALISVGTNLLVGGSRQTIGFVSSLGFDEVKISLVNTALVTLGTTKIYTAFFENFCPTTIACYESYAWTNSTFPVIIDGNKTGINGVVCLACAVNDVQNVLTSNTTDFSQILVTAGVSSSGSIAISDQLYTYPVGTFAGFTIKDLNNLVELDLFQSLSISTYLDGNLQEIKGGAQLIGLSLVVPIFGIGPGIYNVGFKVVLPFDEIRISVGSLVSLINNINVYGAFVDTSNSNGGTLICSSSISITKDGTYVDNNSDGKTNIGDSITYVLAVSNTGNTTLNTITVTDTNAVVTGGPLSTLAAGASDSSTFTAVHNLTQADIDAGIVYNLATVVASPLSGAILTASSTDLSPCITCPTDPNCLACTMTPLTQNPSLALVKTASVSGSGALGDVITYTFTVINTGNTTLTNIAITDPMVGLSISNSPIASLAPGASSSAVSGTYTILQSDIDAGSVTNSALATGKDPNNTDVTDTSGTATTNNTATVTPLTQSSSLALVKTASVSGSGVLGDVITYTFAVTNTGNTTITTIVITDPMVGLSISNSPIASLAPGATNNSVRGTYSITSSDITIGSVTNSALASGKDPNNNDVTDISGTTTTNDSPTIRSLSNMVLVKSASVSGSGALGDVITYTFAVTNTGNTTITAISITDPMVGLSISNSPISSLAPGASSNVVTGTYTIVQSDIDAGSVTNTALASGKDPNANDVSDISGTTTTNDSPLVITLSQSPSLALVKTASVSGSGALGDVITYTFAVSNTGNTSLSNIVITDPMTGLSISNSPIVSLAPGASSSAVSGTYTILQSDIDAGSVTNSALATGKNPNNTDVTDTSGTTNTNNTTTVTPLIQNPSLALVKTASVSGSGALGDVITYTFAVTNTGNTTLSNIVITDPTAGLSISNSPIASLAPGASNSAVRGTYTILQSDIDAGSVTNSALATGKDPNNTDVTDISGTTNTNNTATLTPLAQSSSLALVKTASVSGSGVLGDVITYTFAVTNTGNTTITTIVITDPMVGLSISNSPIASLAPGATNNSVRGTYSITSSDITTGSVTNSALASGKDPNNNDVTDISGTTTSNDSPTIRSLSNMVLVKTASISGSGALGDVITYTFAVTNTGNTTITAISITDPMAGLSISNSPISSLAPGASSNVVTGTYTIVQSDIDAGSVTNTALATGKDPNNNDVTDISGTTTINDTPTETTLTQSPSLALVKTASILGGVITYTFVVSNTGNTTLTNIAITDPLVGLSISNSPIASLAPGASSSVVRGTYTIVQSDIDAGSVTNSALATGKDPNNNNVTDISGTATSNNTATVTLLTQSPSLALVKTASVSGSGALGDVITYTFTVTNTGNTTLTNIAIIDPLVGLSISNSPLLSLAPGAISNSIKGTYTILQSDIDAGSVSNTALVTAKEPNNTTISDTSGTTITNDTPTVTALIQNSRIALVKTARVSGSGVLGDVITYTFAVSNTGNTTLTNIAITDPLVGLSISNSPIANLAPGASSNLVTGTYTILQTDIDAGSVTNSALATGKAPNNTDVTDISGTAITNDTPTVRSLANMALVKTASVSGSGALGDVITYTFAVTNIGTTVISAISITDPMVGLVISNNFIGSLAPGATNNSITGTYTILQSDIDAGSVTNSALATGKDPNAIDVPDISGLTISDDSPTITTLIQSPSLALVKSARVSANAALGDVITYAFAVTNTGNTTLTNIAITDPTTGLIILNSPIGILVPGATNNSVTGTYTILQSDIDAGSVTNSALASGKDPKNNAVSDTSGTTITDDSPTVTILSQSSSLALVKTASVSGSGALGDVITYTFAVSNTGNTTLTNIAITDSTTGLIILNSPIVSLAPGATNNSVRGTYSITQSDIDSGSVSNSALATGKDPNAADVSDISGTSILNDTATLTTLGQNPSIALIETAVFDDNNGDGYAQVGETIHYTFTVINRGDVPLTNVGIVTLLPGIMMTGGPINLSVGESNTSAFIGVYIISQQDIINRSVTDQSTANGTSPLGILVHDLSDDTSPLENDPTVISIDGCTLEIFNAVSPNDDGHNDFFYIRGIECYPNNTVEIYNRWGIKVFTVQGYDNKDRVFRGLSEGRVTVNKSEGLPSGTYFYTIKYVDFSGNGIDKTGYLNITRD